MPAGYIDVADGNLIQDEPAQCREVPTVFRRTSGKANFQEMPPGVYYVFGSTRYGDSHLLWNSRVELKPGGQTLTLTQTNATVLQ